MSTRCSIIYDFGIHLYWECNNEEICLALPGVDMTEEAAKSWGSRLGEGYGDLVVDRAKLVEWRDELNRFLENYGPDKCAPANPTEKAPPDSL